VELAGSSRVAPIFTVGHLPTISPKYDNPFDDQLAIRQPALADRLRDNWKHWQGNDSIHEIAFGEFSD
jgi:hypothetical protein